MSESLKSLSEQEGAPAKAPSLIEVGTTRNEFGSLPNLQSQKNWHFALVRDGKDKTIRLKNGNRVFALRFDGDMTKDSYEKQQPVPLTRLGDLDEKDFLSGADIVSKGVFQVHRSTPNSIHGTLQDGKNNSSMIFEIGDDGKWVMRPKPKVRLAQLATKFVSNVGSGKQANAVPSSIAGAVLGGGIGALLDKKNRLRGGLLGAAGGGLIGGGAGYISELKDRELVLQQRLRGTETSLQNRNQQIYEQQQEHQKDKKKIWGDYIAANQALGNYRRSIDAFKKRRLEILNGEDNHISQGYFKLLQEKSDIWDQMWQHKKFDQAGRDSWKPTKRQLELENLTGHAGTDQSLAPKRVIDQLNQLDPEPPTIKSGSLCCPECGKTPGKYRIHGDAIQCGACEKTSDMEKWDKTAATDEEIRKTLKVYAVDLDGTLAHNDGRDFDPDHIGKPVPGMMRLVRLWLRRGHEVRIFTARAADKKNIPRIKEWLKEHDLPDLEVTNEKTPEVSFIYDDRAVQVEKNTGKLAKLSSLFASDKIAIVEQEGDEWLLYTRDKSRVLGRHKKPEDAHKQEYAIQKSKERSKLGLLCGHFKTAGSIPFSGLTRIPAVAGETASAISNGTFIEGAGKGVDAVEKGINSVAGVTGALDLANTAITTIKPLGSALVTKAPAVSKGLGFVAKKIAPPVWAASMAMQTGELVAHPVESAIQSHKELSEMSLLGRVWAGASNPPKAILGGAKAVYDAGGAVADYAKEEMKGTISALKNWYNTSGPGSLHHQPIKKSGGLIGKYLQVLRDRFCAARKNVNASPSEAQIKAQNYRMGHVWVQGLDITIESPKGSTRSGMDSKGNKWSVTMKNDYGYIRNHPRSEADGDHVDVFVGDHPDSEVVFVIDQFIDGKWDEHKVVVGAKTEKEARQTYLDNYAQKNWKGLRSITALTMRQFKKWLTDGDTSKPLAGQQYRDFLKTAEHDIQYPKIIGDIVHSDLVAKPALAIGSGALRGMAVASIIHALRRAKRDAFDQSHRGLSLLKDLGTGAMIGAGTGLLAHAIPPVAENLYDTFDVQPDSKLQKLSAHFMDVVLAPVNSTPGIGSVLGAGYGALAGAGKGIYRRTKGFLTGDPPEPDAIKNDIIDGMAQGANYGAYFGLTGPNPPPPPSNPKTKVINTSDKLKKMRAVIPPRR